MKTKIKKFSKVMLVAITTLLISVISSCSKDNDSPSSEPTPNPIPVSDFFIGGYTSTSPSVEFYYKNNVKTSLAVATNELASVRDIYVDGNDVYIAGHVYVYPATGNSYTQPCYWKNGVKINLPYIGVTTEYADTEKVTVANGNVYVVGVVAENFSAKRQIVVWRNGVISYITTYSETNSYLPSSICIYNDDIYIGGTEYNGTNINAKFWKNGAPTSLTTTNSSYCSNISVNETGVHATFSDFISGGITTTLKYWKNGVTTTISSQSPYGYGKMYLKGSDVYISGSEVATGSTTTKACYWKNGVKTDLSNGNTLIANSIKVGANGDVFVFSESGRTVWRNNVSTIIGESTEFLTTFDINNK
jgi:hypothetical protein